MGLGVHQPAPNGGDLVKPAQQAFMIGRVRVRVLVSPYTLDRTHEDPTVPPYTTGAYIRGDRKGDPPY